MSVELAISLTEKSGFYVFPVKHGEDNTKTPLTPHGHKDASRDPNVIMDWWGKYPNARAGVACGKSGIIVADIDTKNGVDGWSSLDEAWLDLGEPYSYETGTGGSHLVYLAPEGLNLAPHVNYRGMKGVDVRAGESWVLWAGGVPVREELNEAPQWLLDESKPRTIEGFDGEIRDWYENLVPGDPNVMVRRALERIGNDLSHEEMVAKTFEAIRLGCEGATGVPELIDALEEAWMNRPAENHTTPESAWQFKFQEALLGGIGKFGGAIDLLKDLPEYNIGLVPKGIPDSLVTTPGGKAEFSRLLGELVKETQDDNRILSILWNAQATRDLARDWGLQFVYKRIQDARVRPEPTRENPRIEEKRAAESEGKDTDLNLLTDEERAWLDTRPTFVDHVEEVARQFGWTQFAYFRAVAWASAALTYSFKGFVPMKGTQKLNLNLWMITMGYSGSGKTTALDFRNEILRTLFSGDSEELPSYDLGTDSSPQGLHLALLERDGHPSFFGTDEASGFFKTLGKREWDSGLEDTLSMYYTGFVPPSNKLNLKEMKGKSARTAFTQQMFATPDRLTETLSRDQFKSGFLARYVWSFGHKPLDSDDRFELSQSEDLDVFDESPEEVRKIAADLITSAAKVERGNPVALKGTPEVLKRLSNAYRDMFRKSENREHWDIVEPSVTRLMESMLKAAGICAMYRGDSTILMDDALHAIKAAEEWLENLHRVVAMISAGDWQRLCDEIEDWVRQRGGSASKAQILNRFRNNIAKDGREIDNYLNFLTESGILNRMESGGGAIKYEING